MPPTDLRECYHTASCGVVILKPWEEGDLFVNYFPGGAEPHANRKTKYDTPECAGRVEGELYVRGGILWEISITRWVHFDVLTYPHLSAVSPYPVIYATPQEHAQKWLSSHLDALPKETSTASWGSLSLTKATVDADGTTDNDWAFLTYKITGSKAS